MTDVGDALKVYFVPMLMCDACHAGPYKASLLKAFQRTVEEARFNFVIVDANNLRLEDFKIFWSAGQV